ncbi:cyclase family protein [Amorphoplanes digitatis]|uniref:Kynurenine formamidase n=1 Tax=Actinoplanes digitatis TaxID=1868 RepID=A0A7W7HVR1_9ACTN|nr:cyclase family protein [Actinoplanes digitatis]MBB4761682.1 kynurenine formamidase [Actinoplanes digitatis]GID90792.1 cyclase [Actinoplanes digitatis]
MKVFDLAQPMRRGMPQSPNHPAYTHALVRRHGDRVRPGGGSAANDILVTGTHVGTHIDALAHVSQDGLLHGGVVAASVQSDAGFSRLGIDEFPPFVGRGVFLDVAALHGVPVLPPGYAVTAAELSAAAGDLGIGPGDAVLVGTGWSRLFSDHSAFVGAESGVPGVGEDAARWLVERGVAVTGGETIAYEAIAPGAGHATLPVHRILLVEAGIHIVETMLLSGLADAGVTEFQLILAPLKLVGATGSPVRPLAVVP